MISLRHLFITCIYGCICREKSDKVQHLSTGIRLRLDAEFTSGQRLPLRLSKTALGSVPEQAVDKPAEKRFPTEVADPQDAAVARMDIRLDSELLPEFSRAPHSSAGGGRPTFEVSPRPDPSAVVRAQERNDPCIPTGSEAAGGTRRFCSVCDLLEPFYANKSTIETDNLCGRTHSS